MSAGSERDDERDIVRFTDEAFMHELDGPISQLATALRAANQGWARERLGEETLLAERLSKLLRGARQIRAVAPACRHPINVHDAIELALELTWHDVASRACLIRDYRPVPMVHGHVATLARALIAVLRNAGEAIPAVIPAANRISVETDLGEDGMVSIDVRDTGIGIQAGDLPYVFEPFFTTKGETAAGLGLSAAREAVESLGGGMRVESEPGKGTLVRIRLEATVSTAPEVLPGVHSEAIPLRRVLVVADDNRDRRGLGRLLRDRETEILYAGCEAALERLALGEPFDLVVWDTASWEGGGYRERLAQVAPECIWRTFACRPPPRDAGLHAAAQ